MPGSLTADVPQPLMKKGSAMTRHDAWTRGLGFSMMLWAAPALAAQPRAALPAAFEPNAGQTDPSVRYLLRTQPGTFFFAPSEVVFAPSTSGASPVRVRFVGANPAPRFATGPRGVATVNYLLGADPKRWRTGLPTYSEIRYEDLYPGVALAYGAEGGLLKGTYTVAPGTDPQRIRWRYQDGKVSVDEAGRLQVRTGSGAATLTKHAPIAWQQVGGRRVPVAARYAMAGDGSVGFAVGKYDRGRTLTIDPVIEYSTPSSVQPRLDPAVGHEPQEGHEDVDGVRDPLLREGQGYRRRVER